MSEGWEQAYEPQSPTSEGEYGSMRTPEPSTAKRLPGIGLRLRHPVEGSQGNDSEEHWLAYAYAEPRALTIRPLDSTCYPYLRLQVDREHGSGCQQSWEMYKPSESREL